MYDKIKPSKKRVKKNIAALNSLIKEEESSMTKRKFRLKPLIIAAAITVSSGALLFSANAASKGTIVKFFMGDKEIEGEHNDYVDEDGFRRISFDAELPLYEDSYAVIYDVDAPQGENVRVITKETDPDFMEKIRLYHEERDKAYKAARSAFEETGNSDELIYQKPDPEDFGITMKHSELCIYSLVSHTETRTEIYGGEIGGEFRHTGKAAEKPSGLDTEEHRDFDNGTHTYHHTLYYYVGKEQAQIKNSKEIEGEYYDYVDKDGFRQVSFGAVVPIDEDTYAAIYDVDAPQGENVRVLTPESDPEFFKNMVLYQEANDKAWEEQGAIWKTIRAWKGDIEKDSYAMDAAKQEAIDAGIVDPSDFPVFPEPEDYGLVFKDSEICLWSRSYIEYVDEVTHHHNRQGSYGGKFMNMGAAEWKASGASISREPNEIHYDYENGTQTIKQTFYYYVGKEQQLKNSKEIDGEYYDNVDNAGNRHITFDAVLPYEEMSYAIVYDVDAPKDKNVRFITPATDPDFFVNVRRYLDDRDKSIKESAAMWDKINAWKGDYDESDSRLRDAVLQEAIEAGIVDPSEVPNDPKPEDYLFECKDSELCVWEYIYRDKPGRNHSSGGSFGGEFLGKSGEQKFEDKLLGDGTKAIKHTFKFHAGNEE